MGSLYAAVLFIGITNGTAVQPVVSVERFVSYRERAAGMYSALPFAFAQVWILVLLSCLCRYKSPTFVSELPEKRKQDLIRKEYAPKSSAFMFHAYTLCPGCHA